MRLWDYISDNKIILLVCFASSLFFSVILISFGVGVAEVFLLWDAVHQYEIYAQENGADYAFGWTWCYDHGKGAGDQPSYAVYMKEGDPLYGTVYHVGDYLPDGTQFSGTNDEWEAFIKQDFRDRAEADGYDVYDDPDGDGFIIDLDGSYNPNN